MSCHPGKGAFAVLVAFGAVLALGGCAGTAIIDHTYQQSYSPGEWHGYPLPVYVRGTPYAEPHAEIEQAVVTAMQATPTGFATRFVPAAPGASPAYRVVMMFTPPPGVDGYALCAARPEPPAAAFGVPPASRVELLGALCRGYQAISTAYGTVPTTGGPDGAVFRNGISDFTLALLPAQTPPRSSPPQRING